MSSAATSHWLDMAQLADLLGVKKSWVEKQAAAGQLPHRRLGRYVRFAPDDVAEIQAAAARKPLPAFTAPVALRPRRVDGRRRGAA